MKRIGLIDVDYTGFPNLALMKISSHHKRLGDHVEWYIPFSARYDVVYISKVFSFTPDIYYHINADVVVRGGAGYAIETINNREVFNPALDRPLDDIIEHEYPDYSLYGISDTAYGFLTRGCPRGCEFCIVGKKEGRCSRKHSDLNEFWNGQKNIVLNDPNILACKDWKELLMSVRDSKAWVDFNQGLDIRLITEEKIEFINQIKMKTVRFAWDKYDEKDLILPKFQFFAKHSKLKLNHNAVVYTIVNYNTSFEQDLDRVYTLRELGYYPYIMVYQKQNCDHRYKDLQRWVNNRIIFSKCKRFEDYKA